MIWRSEGLGPDTKISWNVEYGLNWTKTLPTVGSTVVLGSFWHACDKGQILDINSGGYFVPSTKPAIDGFMAVGQNSYVPQTGGGIYIIVGLKDATGKYNPIYYEPTALYTSGGGQYVNTIPPSESSLSNPYSLN